MSSSNIPKLSLSKFKSTPSLDIPIPGLSPPKHNSSLFLNLSPDLSTIDSHKALDLTLPHIHTKLNSKNASQTNPEDSLRIRRARSMKKGSNLQMWLDQTLEGGKDAVAMCSVKKYGIDRKYLLSQNIPAQTIDKIYQQLYIYSQGLSNTITELLSSSSPSLIRSFWKTFTKLLQTINPFECLFQQIQSGHLKTIAELQQSIADYKRKYDQERANWDQQRIKLNKKSAQISHELHNLRVEYAVTQSTLSLTEMSFQEQVTLRLKFQQKINQMHASYHQIKNKYDYLVDNLHIKENSLAEHSNHVNKLQRQIDELKIRCQQFMELRSADSDKIRDRENQLGLAAQEHLEITQKLQECQAIKSLLAEQLKAAHADIHRAKLQQIQLRQEIKGKQIELNISKRKEGDLGDRVQYQRDRNDEVYLMAKSLGDKIIEHQKINLDLQSQIQNLVQQNGDWQNKYSKLQKEKTILNRTLIETQQNLAHAKTNLVTLTHTQSKNNELIQHLHTTKDKFQKLASIAIEEKNSIQCHRNELAKKMLNLDEQVEGLRMIAQGKAKEINELILKMNSEREIFRKKLSAMNAQIAQKDLRIRQINDKCQLAEKQVKEIKQKLDLSQAQIISKDRAIKQKQKQTLLLKQKIHKSQQQIIEIRQRLKSVNHQYQNAQKQSLLLEQNLGKYKHRLQLKRESESEEIAYLRQLLLQNEELLKSKDGFVHPMLYEDCRMEIINILERRDAGNKQIIKLNKLIQTLKIQIEKISEAKDQGFQQKNMKINELELKIQNMELTFANQAIQSSQIQSIKQQLQIYKKKLLEKEQKCVSLQQSQKKAMNALQMQYQKSIRLLQLNKKLQKNINQDLQNIKFLQQSLKIYKNQAEKLKKELLNIENLKKSMTDEYTQTEKPFKRAGFQKIFQEYGIQTDQYQIQRTIQRQLSTQRLQPKQIPQKQKEPQKKVQVKDFRRALKLTYMRRD